MATLTNNLYPPLIADTQVPFIRTQNYKIYFDLSQYNNAADIKNVQISLINQRTNISVLNPTKYPSGIKLAPLQYDENKEGDYKYYIEIIVENTFENNDLISNYFDINQYYITQLRFTSVAASDPPLTGGLDTWLYEQRNNFSEWSNISLLKGISQPIVSVNELSQNTTISLDHQLTKISGKIFFLFSDILQTKWIKGSLNTEDEFISSGTRILTEEYINIFNFSNISFKIANNYKYYVYFYDANKNFIRGKSLTIWQKNNKTLELSSDLYYMRVGIATEEDDYIETNASSNILISYTKLLNNSNSLETEYLKSYNIKVYKTNVNINNLIFSTQEIYTNPYNPNEFNCEIPYDFEEGITYILVLQYVTNNSYINSVSYNFNIIEKIIKILDGTIIITPESENGRIKFDIDFEKGININENLLIKRSSSKTDFKIWETLKTIPHNQNSVRNVWYDTTIESGVWYKYRVQENDQVFERILQTTNPTICVFEDIFLTNEEKQLRVQFNPSISDFKYNVMESQYTTLGSKYPFVKRNGNNFFRTFSIGGLISAFMDDKDWYGLSYDNNKFYIENKRQSFTSPYEIYGKSKNLYQNYNLENNIDKYQDYIYEREFRQKVLDFLYKDEIKLFKSLTEGNILIKLQNITFQPITSLGRRLYSFSATAVEIDEANIKNFYKYNLINKYYYSYKIGSITDYFESRKSIISDYILKTSSLSNYNTELLKIFRLNIQLKQGQNALFYVKTLNDPEMVRYETTLGNLQLKFNDNEPIEECYFFGVHLKENQYTITNEYYDTVNDVANPINNRVYYILDQIGNYKINNYISYDNGERLLIVQQSEVEENSQLNYILLVQGEYIKYIYYNNDWYPFSETGDVLMPTHATIIYYYETREAN